MYYSHAQSHTHTLLSFFLSQLGSSLAHTHNHTDKVTLTHTLTHTHSSLLRVSSVRVWLQTSVSSATSPTTWTRTWSSSRTNGSSCTAPGGSAARGVLPTCALKYACLSHSLLSAEEPPYTHPDAEETHTRSHTQTHTL